MPVNCEDAASEALCCERLQCVEESGLEVTVIDGHCAWIPCEMSPLTSETSSPAHSARSQKSRYSPGICSKNRL